MVYSLKDARENANQLDFTIKCPKPVVSFQWNHATLCPWVLNVLLMKSWGATTIWYGILCPLSMGKLIVRHRIKYTRHGSSSSRSSGNRRFKNVGLVESMHTVHIYWAGSITIVISKYRILSYAGKFRFAIYSESVELKPFSLDLVAKTKLHGNNVSRWLSAVSFAGAGTHISALLPRLHVARSLRSVVLVCYFALYSNIITHSVLSMKLLW